MKLFTPELFLIKSILFFFLLAPIFCFSQNDYFFKEGGRVVQNGKIISTEKVRELLVNNQKALDLYNSGRTKKTAGNLLLYGSIVPITYFMKKAYYGNDIIMSNGAMTRDRQSLVPLFGGIAMIALAIPIKIGFSNKIREATALLNRMQKSTACTNFETSFIANINGFGLAIEF